MQKLVQTHELYRSPALLAALFYKTKQLEWIIQYILAFEKQPSRFGGGTSSKLIGSISESTLLTLKEIPKAFSNRSASLIFLVLLPTGDLALYLRMAECCVFTALISAWMASSLMLWILYFFLLESKGKSKKLIFLQFTWLYLESFILN